MQKVMTIDPLDGDDRAELNRLLSRGWTSMFYLPINNEGNILIFYHLINQDEKPDGQEEYEDMKDEEDDMDTDLENNWRVD